MIMAVAVLMRMGMIVHMRVLMTVKLIAVTMLMPVGVDVLMFMLMPVLVTAPHRSASVDFAGVGALLAPSRCRSLLSSAYAGGIQAATVAERGPSRWQPTPLRFG